MKPLSYFSYQNIQKDGPEMSWQGPNGLRSISQQLDKIGSWNLRAGKITRLNPSSLTWAGWYSEERGVFSFQIGVAGDPLDWGAKFPLTPGSCFFQGITPVASYSHPFPNTHTLVLCLSHDRQMLFSHNALPHWAETQVKIVLSAVPHAFPTLHKNGYKGKLPFHPWKTGTCSHIKQLCTP